MHTIYTIHIKRKRRVNNFLENISIEEEKTASKTEKGKDKTFIEISRLQEVNIIIRCSLCS